MNFFTTIPAILLTIFSLFAFADTTQYQATVIGVSDGDTITVLDGNKEQHKIRLQGIDAPEKSQAFGKASRHHLSQLVFSRSVTIQYEKMDRYQRQVGKVIVNGMDANLEQVTNGMAWHYKKYEGEQSSEDRNEYSAAEQKARSMGRGLWIEDNPVPPWEFRKAKRKSS